MNPLQELIDNASHIEEKLGYTFKDKKLLALAFVHRSFVNEHKDITKEHNERLEFLGDSVLGLIVADYLYSRLPSTNEGDLSHMRSHLVEGSSCVVYIHKLKIESYLLLGKGEKMNDGRGRGSILADLFEALIGAIYLDGGILESRKFFFDHFQEEVDLILKEPLRNFKAELQDYTQKKFHETPSYVVASESGPDHSKQFLVVAYVNNEEIGQGVGSSKKEAQQAAAKDALSKIQS
jgi:ribonuclease-3